MTWVEVRIEVWVDDFASLRETGPVYTALADVDNWRSVGFAALDDDDIERVPDEEPSTNSVHPVPYAADRSTPEARAAGGEWDPPKRSPAAPPEFERPLPPDVAASMEAGEILTSAAAQYAGGVPPVEVRAEVPPPTPEELLAEIGQPMSGPGCHLHPGAHDPACAYCAAAAVAEREATRDYPI